MFLINLNRYPGYFKPIPQDSRNNNEDSIKDEKTGLSHKPECIVPLQPSPPLPHRCLFKTAPIRRAIPSCPVRKGSESKNENNK
jgi:hypothetical protein